MAIERENEKFSACGYGLLGLCCSACLLGPCRLSPFDEESAKGLCGDNRDLIVAKNLLRLAIGEAAYEIKNLKQAVLQNISSPYPEKTFPTVWSLFHDTQFPSQSHVDLLLDSIYITRREDAGVGDILIRALQISILIFISEELRLRMNRFAKGKSSSGDHDHLEGFPGIILLIRDDVPCSGSVIEMANEVQRILDRKVFSLSISEMGALPEIGRGLSEKWALPVTEMKLIVLISSRFLSPILGALGLGFTVASFPPLPFHGSGEVEKFFCEDLQKRFGNVYLPSWEEDLVSKLVKTLRDNS